MIRAIAWVTLLEGIRSKTIYGIAVLTGLMMVLTVFVSSMIMRDIGKVATDFSLSAATFASLLVLLFVGITTLARDMERKTVYLALSRSVPRSSYLIGRFCGLALLQAIIMVLLTIGSLATILLVKKMYPNYFGTVSIGLVILAHILIVVQMWLLTALSILFSMVASSAFVTFMLTIITWLIGSSTQEVKRLIETSDTVQTAPVTKLIVKSAYYVFPDFSIFDLKSFAAHGLSVDVSRIGFSLLYAFGYGVAVLSLAIVLFRRKELT